MTTPEPEAERERLEAAADAARGRLIRTLGALDGRRDDVLDVREMARVYALEAALSAGALVAVAAAGYAAYRAFVAPQHLPGIFKLLPRPKRPLGRRVADLLFGMATQAVVQVGLKWVTERVDELPPAGSARETPAAGASASNEYDRAPV